MGEVRQPQPVKVFVGILTANVHVLPELRDSLEQHSGSIDLQSQVLEFDYTNYYEAEMGKGLKRVFFGFQRLINPEALIDLKLFTNLVEQNLVQNGKRTVNLDPGYLTPARVVLASTKDFGHRLYLSRGIYGEVTLMYQKKDFRALPWTYPDYRSEAYLHFFRELRAVYMKQLSAHISTPEPQ